MVCSVELDGGCAGGAGASGEAGDSFLSDLGVSGGVEGISAGVEGDSSGVGVGSDSIVLRGL